MSEALLLKDASGATGIFLAVSAGQLDIVQMLFEGLTSAEKSALLSCANREFRTPLHVAAGYNNTDIASALLNFGAAVDAVEVNKKTPLAIAAQMGSVEVGRLLLSNSPNPADPNAIDWFHQTPLHIACETRQHEFAKMLLDPDEAWSATVNVEAVDNQERTPLITAVLQQDVEMVRILLGTGRCDINYRRPPNYGDTAISIAAGLGMIDVLKMLLEAGAKTEPVDLGDRTPIILAAMKNQPEAIRLLMAAGANINHYPYKIGRNGTAIYSAAYHGFPLAVAALLTDPSINLELTHAEDDDTPLLAAAMQGHGEIVQMLLKAGASTAAVTKDGETFASCCAAGGLTDILKQIVFKDDETKKMLLSGSSDTAESTLGRSLLHHAVAHKRDQLVSVLIEWGADVKVRDKKERTPLQQLCNMWLRQDENSELQVARLLVEKGGGPSQPAEWKELVNSAVDDFHDAIAVFLMDRAGADVSRELLEDLDFLSIAVQRRCRLVVQRALGHRAVASTPFTTDALTRVLFDAVDEFYNRDAEADARLSEVVKLLVDAGAEYATPCDDNGITTLHNCGIKVGAPATLGFLLKRAREQNVDVSKVVDKEGMTILHHICLQSHHFIPKGRRVEMAGLVLQTEASKSTSETGCPILSLEDKKGRTPLDCALTKPPYGQDMDKSDRAGVVDLLLKYGGSATNLLQRRDKMGRTTLMSVAAAGLVDVVRSMMKALRSRSPDDLVKAFAQRDDDDNNVFHHAASKRRFETLRFLVTEFFDPQLTDGESESPTPRRT
ncbi:ankyrin repeat-containing domain protein, partial [Zopfochytrium polystomum]